MDAAPVIPSLNSPVMRELISRILRLSVMRCFWNQTMRRTAAGRSRATAAASFALRRNIITSTKMMYELFQTRSMMRQAIISPILPVSLMTRAWI